MKKRISSLSTKKKSRWQALFLLFILLTFVFFVTFSVFNLPYFYVKNVEIKGNVRLSSSEILEKIPSPFYNSIFKVSLKKISGEILSKLPVKKVKVKRKLPSTVIIEIEERFPYACVERKDGIWEVDEEGVILNRLKDTKGFPLICEIDPVRDKKLLLEAIKVIKTLHLVNLNTKKITFEKEKGIVVELEKGLHLILGTNPNYRYFFYLPYIFEDAKRRKEQFSFLDLRFEGQIIASLK